MILIAASLVPRPHILLLAMTVMVGLLLLTVVFMLVYLLVRRRQNRRLEEWREKLMDTLQDTIYFEPSENAPAVIPINSTTTRLLRQPAFRQLLIDELVQGRKGLAGASAANLVTLFRQLGLDALSAQKLQSRKWHLKALGIQELAAMDQRQYLARIYRLTNAKHELVRMEAQSAIVQLYGFDGLRFLDIIDRPISEWQQIKLLRLLSRMPGSLPPKAGAWLSSANDSVRIFTLKLVAEQHHQQFHPQVVACLDHSNTQVKLQAIRCLKDISTDGTADTLISVYDSQPLPCKLAILETLDQIGADMQEVFLLEQLAQPDNSLKLAAAKALANTGEKGLLRLETFPMASTYPWDQIIQQAKTEKSI